MNWPWSVKIAKMQHSPLSRLNVIVCIGQPDVGNFVISANVNWVMPVYGAKQRKRIMQAAAMNFGLLGGEV